MNEPVYYGRVSKFLHWLIAFLIVGMLILGYFMFDIPNKDLRYQMVDIHKLTGLAILALMIFRITWSLTHPKPLEWPPTAAWQRLAERSVHYLLYSALVFMPLSGWCMSVAAGYVPKFYSLNFNLPIEKNKAVADYWEGIHNTLAVVIIVLISLHVLAALYHYLIKKDKVLQRML